MSKQEIIARAIQKADSSYFFENYDKQARAVISALEREGFQIVPRVPEDKQIEAGKAVVTSGRVRPGDFVQAIYAAMVRA